MASNLLNKQDIISKLLTVNDLKHWALWWDIVKIAIPSILSFMLYNSYTLVDYLMVRDLGTNPFVGLGLVQQLALVFQVFFYAAANSINTFLSQSIGNGNHSKFLNLVWDSLALVLVNSLVLSLPFMFPDAIAWVLSDNPEVQHNVKEYLVYIKWAMPSFLIGNFLDNYFRSQGKNYVEFIRASFILGLNIFLNWTLIWGNLGFPRMEVKGAGLATFIALYGSNILYFAYYLIDIHYMKKRYQIKESFFSYFKKVGLSIHWANWKRIILLGIPFGLSGIFDFGGFVIVQVMVEHNLGQETSATFLACIKAFGFAFLLNRGLGIAIASKTGRSIGQNKFAEVHSYTKVASIISFVLTIILISFMAFYGEEFISLIAPNEKNIVSMGRDILLIFSYMLILDIFAKIPVNVLQGAGDKITILKILLISMWGFFVPVSFIYVVLFKGNIYGVWLIFSIYVFIQALLFVSRYVKGKWQHISL